MTDQKKKPNATELIRSEQSLSTTRYEPRDFNEMLRLSQSVIRSGLAPSSVRKTEDAMVILMNGAELGLTAMQSLRSIHVINGRPVLSADLMVALVRRSSVCEHFSQIELTDKRCVYETKRSDAKRSVRYEFTWADAQRAGLTGRDVWKKYPKNMLRARCASSLARAEYPELLMGVYDPDELASESAREKPSRDRPAPAPAPKQKEETEVIDVHFEEASPAVEAEAETAVAAEPINWAEHPEHGEEWNKISRRLHALIAECGLNGVASEAMREELKKLKSVDSYTHLSPAYLATICTRLSTKSPAEGHDGSMPPRMETILSFTGLDPALATAHNDQAENEESVNQRSTQ